ncbi:NAD(P)H-dependent oxidoreductase subunit E [Puniceicoccales bacterium CK1056]|uniref:NAD(P)H-dependent oxidoreductase subunit E n=1 Tax=Oceanipulchritudo coccoides TaxID=2706888 RepID=A0A6B2M211_9BACT|nr:NAD(P)H-dependent oxidoreductase subunit E [Oceanipulchritudo coccoides]NDV62416.1 NAD(P)H-dependent oxidoreductase subunit E [Oceanipulchritudo coccoides]
MAFELSTEILEYIDKLIPRYPEKRSAIMMILHAIQKEKGFLSLEAQEWVAEKLELTPIQVREVVTFYPFYREKPIGKRHIRVCRTLSCALNGSYAVCDRFKEAFDTELDEISPDGRVTVEFAECLASCGTAPVVMVDDKLYENLNDEQVEAICNKIKEETPANPKAGNTDVS